MTTRKFGLGQPILDEFESAIRSCKYTVLVLSSAFFLDPKILLSLLMWAMYMLLLFTRWNSGWRGRRAAFLSSFAFLIALVAFAANYFSGVHHFLQS